MRALLIVSGILLWLNAFASRQELFDAWISACGQFDTAIHSGDPGLTMQGLVAALATLVLAPPTWKLIAGGLFLKFSVETDLDGAETVRSKLA